MVNNSNHFGPLAVGVPGTVAGLYLAHKRLGSMAWSDLVQPAVELALNGIPITYSLQTGFERSASRLRQYPASARKFFKADGSSYRLGETWVQPDLAHTLELIRDHGADGFIGEKMQNGLPVLWRTSGADHGEDLAAYEAKEREPIRGSYRGYDIVSMPPPSSGGWELCKC